MVLIAIALIALVLILIMVVMNSLPAYIWYELFAKNSQIKEFWICNKRITFGIFPYFCLLPIIFFLTLTIYILKVSALSSGWFFLFCFVLEIILIGLYFFYLWLMYVGLKKQGNLDETSKTVISPLFQLLQFFCANIFSSSLFVFPIYIFLFMFVVNGIGVSDEIKLFGLVVFIFL